ncbi:hypothetical protein SEA_BRUHMOMENT_105 [Arthrobacter phage BruhMoment]|nr:hypothetical protein SEA_BRUHMOMENT_105 [Arthrobacter phage BruhMoment]
MIAATFHSPQYSPPNYDFNTIEVFNTLEDVIEALFDRYFSNGRRMITSEYLDGSNKSAYWPSVEAGSYFTCYLHDSELPTGNLLIGEDVQLDIHTAVHGGHWDYTVTLAESEQGTLVAQVERAGI